MRPGMELQKVKGYDKLSKGQQDLFVRVNAKHIATVENKSSWTPTNVKWDKTYLKVTFKNGEWLHYTPGGEWY